MNFQPSKYQQAVYDAISNPDNNQNLLILARAGSGKTYTIVEAAKLIPNLAEQKVGFLAFNKHIAKELKTKLPKDVACSTMHAKGLSRIIAYNRGMPEIDSYGMFIRKHIQSRSQQLGWIHKVLKAANIETDSYHERKQEEWAVKVEFWDTFYNLLEMCKCELALKPENVQRVIRKHKFDFKPSWAIWVTRIFKELYFGTRDVLSKITLTDMIFLPAIRKVGHTQFDIVFVDECQDLNRCQIENLRLMCHKNTRVIAVGDKKQSIYGFAGADSEALDSLQEMFNMQVLKLPICYRCDKRIIDFVQELVADIEAFKDQPELSDLRYSSIEEIDDGDFVLCRVNSLLMELAVQLILQGKPAKVRGVDIGRNLSKLLRKSKTKTLKQFVIFMDAKIDKAKAKLEQKGLSYREIQNDPTVSNLREQLSIVEAIAYGFDILQVEGIIQKINSIFSDDTKGIILSSIHKSKGLEADTVHILGDNMMPFRTDEKADWEMEQEMNLIYVAYTRAKKQLLFINDFEPREPQKFETDFEYSNRLELYLNAHQETEQVEVNEPATANSFS